MYICHSIKSKVKQIITNINITIVAGGDDTSPGLFMY